MDRWRGRIMNRIIWNEDKWAKFVIAVEKSIEIMKSHTEANADVEDFEELWEHTLRRMKQSETKTYNFWIVKNHMINKQKHMTLLWIKEIDRELSIYSFSAMVRWWQ